MDQTKSLYRYLQAASIGRDPSGSLKTPKHGRIGFLSRLFLPLTCVYSLIFLAIGGCGEADNNTALSNSTRGIVVTDKRAGPKKIVIEYLTVELDETKKELTDAASIARVWSFITSHPSQESNVEAPAPYNVWFRCEMPNGETVLAQYQEREGGFRLGDRYGVLTEAQRKDLSQIVRDYVKIPLP